MTIRQLVEAAKIALRRGQESFRRNAADHPGPAEVRFDELAEGAKENPKPVAYVGWTWRW